MTCSVQGPGKKMGVTKRGAGQARKPRVADHEPESIKEKENLKGWYWFQGKQEGLRQQKKHRKRGTWGAKVKLEALLFSDN